MNLPAVFKSAVKSLEADGLEIESINVTTTRNGHRKCEVAFNDGKARTFMYFVDRGAMVERHQYTLRGWSSRQERDREIRRLYENEHMTQEFIASVMGLTQSRISQIVAG